MLCVKLHYLFCQMFVDVHMGAKDTTRIHGCHWGVKKVTPGLKWLSGDHDSLPEVLSPEQKSNICLPLGGLPQGEKGTTAPKP